MRLSLHEIKSIVRLKDKFFGEQSRIYLFGSRVDDDQKGGDIDLYIKPDSFDTTLEKKIKFLARLKAEIGEQKIDLILPSDEKRLIDVEAQQKGIELDLDKIKLQKYFNECDKHLQRIEESLQDVIPIIPLSASSYKNLNKGEVQALDQYLFRFAKLQDTIGDKIFKLLIQKYEPSDKVLPFVDILNQLEKIGLIESAKEWIYLREIRNEVSHSYDDEPLAMAQALNSIVNQKDIIKKIYLKLKDATIM